MSKESCKVRIEYFASLREEAGVAEEEIRTSAATAEELFDELRERHGFTLDRTALKLVVNEEFTDWSQEVKEGDPIVVIPPVAGG